MKKQNYKVPGYTFKDDSFCHKMRALKLEETLKQEKSEFVLGRKYFQATGVRWPWQQVLQ